MLHKYMEKSISLQEQNVNGSTLQPENSKGKNWGELKERVQSTSPPLKGSVGHFRTLLLIMSLMGSDYQGRVTWSNVYVKTIIFAALRGTTRQGSSSRNREAI